MAYRASCPREELNLNLLLRRETSYPLNYEGNTGASRGRAKLAAKRETIPLQYPAYFTTKDATE